MSSSEANSAPGLSSRTTRAGQRRARRHLARQLHAGHERVHVLALGQRVGEDPRLVARVARAQPHPPAAARAHEHRPERGGVAVELGGAVVLEEERADVEREVGGRQARARPHERGHLRGRGRERPAPAAGATRPAAWACPRRRGCAGRSPRRAPSRTGGPGGARPRPGGRGAPPRPPRAGGPAGPMPDRSSSCGEPIAPAARITSRSARATRGAPPAARVAHAGHAAAASTRGRARARR